MFPGALVQTKDYDPIRTSIHLMRDSCRPLRLPEMSPIFSVTYTNARDFRNVLHTSVTAYCMTMQNLHSAYMM